MSDSVVLPVNRFTVLARALRQGGRTSDGWSALAWIMSTTPMHNSEASPEVRELTEDQLEQVSGGKPSAARDRPAEYLVMTLKDVIIT
jgi:bacteriocin-like protein